MKLSEFREKSFQTFSRGSEIWPVAMGDLRGGERVLPRLSLLLYQLIIIRRTHMSRWTEPRVARSSRRSES